MGKALPPGRLKRGGVRGEILILDVLRIKFSSDTMRKTLDT